MAAGYLSAPGTEYGPCTTECDHTDCAQTRRMMAMACHYCNEVIGERGFFNDTADDAPAWSSLVHATCAYEAIDANGSS